MITPALLRQVRPLLYSRRACAASAAAATNASPVPVPCPSSSSAGATSSSSCSSRARAYGVGASPEDTVTVHFMDPNQPEGMPPQRLTIQAPVGSTIVDVAKAHGVDIHAACGQKLQCATCHVIVQDDFFKRLDPQCVREGDMLEMAPTLTETSRLGCQVKLTPELDGLVCTLPDSEAKGLIRMTLSQPRPKIETDWAPGGVPAVAPRMRLRAARPYNGHPPYGGLHGVSTSTSSSSMNGAETSGPSPAVEELWRLRQQLEEQQKLSARLEFELRQQRGHPFVQAVKSGEGKKAATAVEAEGSKGGDEDDLAKLKAELEKTRIKTDGPARQASLDDVIGLAEAKRALREAVIWPAVADKSLFSGVRGSARGLLLYGPPGCGKTMLARAAATELGSHVSFFHVRPGDIMSKYYGDSHKRIQALEELVQESAPAIVFFDEVDSLLGSRDGSNVAEHHRSTTNALLAWMDGFGTSSERVFFLGATNRAEAIDEAALRRFGEAAEVSSPCKDGRLNLLSKLSLEKAPSQGHLVGVDGAYLEDLAERTEGLSFADLDALVRRAFLEVLRDLPEGVRPGLRPEDVPPVAARHFEAALDRGSGSSALKEMLRKRGEKRGEL
eukprot:TRINITY_DN23352_c0_g1_i1.p1 TRINITY_DN23352_c0_g1~~TRINITY_DN23352_c0_g1_i1.p1  ORF type:complete len:614 (-),score=165.08 TRINITY_DN23352_c0_g1_i1:243-2084(-)